MDRQAHIRDYATLAMVGRRRALAMQEQLRSAQAEHERCLAHHADSTLALQASIEAVDGYALKLGARTSAGRSVRLEDLQGARSHGKTLQAARDDAERVVSESTRSVAVALAACTALRRKLAANDARVAALDDQAKAWTRALAMEQEDREEDERGDSHRPRLL